MALFDDENEDDLRIVKEGPFEFRILEKEIDHVKHIGNWLMWKTETDKQEKAQQRGAANNSNVNAGHRRKGSF
jgi:hypothetical protein